MASTLSGGRKLSRRRISLVIGVAALTGCAHRAVAPAIPPWPVERAVEALCAQCTLPPGGEVRAALETRIVVLKGLGGACSEYGKVLETSLAAGRIGVRPYMWRVGSQLASAQARPDGDILVAREIDSLNVGVRKVADVIRSVEHEAAHIAFAIPSGEQSNEASVNSHVGECRVGSP